MKKWQFRNAQAGSAPAHWAAKLGISPLLLNILWARGFSSCEQIDTYLSGRLASLAPPNIWPQIPDVAEAIVRELRAGKKMAVWGDYDVDGITATTLVLDVLDEHGFHISHHLPDRMKEGYGLNIESLRILASEGVQTVLTVDCGIGDYETVAAARELGLTIIVSDHHMPPEDLPPAAGIVNPRMGAPKSWPSTNLAGVGVAFFLMAAVNSLLAPHTGKRYKMDNALDIVALGTLADVMTLDAQNRILVRAGLEKLSRPVRPGLVALKHLSGMDITADMNSVHAVFRLAPRINAAGRMGHPELALRLLRSRDNSMALTLAQQLDECNTKRKTEEERIHKEARQQAQELLEKRNYSGLVLYGPDWHPGIVGIVASRIVEEFNRPAFVLCDDNASIKGSGRSLPGFDLHGALGKCASCLLGFGGHTMAAGVRLQKNMLQDFRNIFSDMASASLGVEPLPQTLLLECELGFANARDCQFLHELDLMQPFGTGNEEPVFVSRPLLLKGRSYLGKTRQHVRLDLQEMDSGIELHAKAWRRAEEFPPSLVGQQIRIAYTPRLNNWQGIPDIDLDIKDWRIDRTGRI